MASKYRHVKILACAAIMLLWLAVFPSAAGAIPCDADSGLLWLVNRENPLEPGFRPADLVRHQGVELRRPARDAFLKLLTAMETEGIHGLQLKSAYRTYSYQRAILNQRIKELMAAGHDRGAAEALALRSIQPPGASEHQLGLALDVSAGGGLAQSFAETRAGRWLEEHCHEYGFIIRYPQSKTEVTDIIYEPWHLRYVGAPHALIMKETALTLEEYHRYLKGISMYLAWGEDGNYFLVRYVENWPQAGLGQAGSPACAATLANAPGVVDVSSTGPGEAGYIVTASRLRPPRW